MTADERLALIRRKVEWAERHFDNLEVIKNRFIESNPYTFDSKPDSKPGHEGLHEFFPISIKEIEPSIALLAGDIIHNLRSALDHLVCHLVEVAGNPVTDDTMFPIFRGDVPNESTLSRKVKGVRDSAKQKIRETEPYKDGKGHYLWVLHKLDIADKHHALLTTIHTIPNIGYTLRGSLREGYRAKRAAFPNFGEPLEVGKPFLTCIREEYDDMKITFDVSVTEPGVIERKPVLWLTKALIDKVDSLIIEFRPDLV
jgi:hypothetical protein